MAPFIHDRALVESDSIGDRTRVWAFAHVMPGAVIGADCNICDHVFVETGVVLGDRVTVKNNSLLWDGVWVGDDVFIGPNVVFTNDLVPRPLAKTSSTSFLPTVVKEGVTVGANATIVCGVTIGAHAFVGAGAVVVRDVAEHSIVIGNPAQHAGWICSCGCRLDGGENCGSCGRQFC